MQILFGSGPIQKLNCTANDVRIARATEVSPTTCVRGEIFDLTATFEVNVTIKERYDLGFYFDISSGPGGDGARGRTCSLSTIGHMQVDDLDGDFCSVGTLLVTFMIPNILCSDDNGDSFWTCPPV